eukprot:sb/3466178/
MGGEVYNYPNIMISTDILQVSKENDYGKVLVTIDSFSKWTAISILRKGTAKEVAKALLKDWISIHGVPVYIKSDNGKCFKEAELIKELWRVLGVETRYTSPYNPRANGQVERMNGTILQILRKVSMKNPEKWKNAIPLITLAINTSVSKNTNMTPAELMMGRNIKGIDAITLGIHRSNFYLDGHHYKSEQYKKLLNIYEIVAQETGLRWKAYKSAYDINKRTTAIKEGDKVLVHRPIKTQNLYYKLDHGFLGPFIVEKIYSEHTMLLADPTTRETRIENRSLIKKIPDTIREEAEGEDEMKPQEDNGENNEEENISSDEETEQPGVAIDNQEEGKSYTRRGRQIREPERYGT